MGSERVYLTDDRDIDEDRHVLAVFQGENGDWYVSVRPETHRFGRAVRITTSGTPREHAEVPLAVARLYRAIGTGRAEAEHEEAIAATLALDTPWPLHSVLAKLADAADHLLTDHDCDTHGHEEIAAARDAARRILAALDRLRAAKGRP